MDGLKKINVLNLTKNHKNNDDEINKLIERISSGNAVLFTGAGFSTDMTNMKGSIPPRASVLANSIGEIGGFDGDGDLMFASDYYLEYGDEEKLVNLLREEFRIKEVATFHETIVKEKWRRIYTTNYDDGIKHIATNNNLPFECINIDDDPRTYFNKKNTCIHINGSIESLKSNVIPNSFKLTDSSYISPESFEKSNWYFSFKKDIEQASAIVFVGYSLYDIEIKKLLFASEFSSKKTYFITHKDASQKSIFQLGQYGRVLTIGLENFAHHLHNKKIKINTSEEYFDCFEKYKLGYPSSSITDNIISDFLYHGNLAEDYINDALANNNSNTLPYLVERRNFIEKSIDLLSQKNFMLLLSDFGNGKTVLLKELASTLSILGKEVFVLRNIDSNYISDIEKIAKLNCEAYLLIDDYQNVTDLVEYLLTIDNPLLKVIITTRTSYQEHISLGLPFKDKLFELNIDILEENELKYYINVLDNLGVWESKAYLTSTKKLEILTEKHLSQFSHTLLNIFNAPQIKNRIDNILNKLFNNTDYKDTIFAICILEVLNLPLSFSNISEVALNNEIYSSKLHSNNDFKQIFPSHNHLILSKSSLYARSLLQNHFTGIYTVDKLLNIAETLQSHRNNGNIENIIYKNLLRFAFIESALTQENKLNMITRYYEQLKRRIHRLEKTPHFWLQYAMARIANDDVHNAQKFLNTAYALAFDGYNTSYLDVQQARVHLFLAKKELTQNKSIKHFLNAHNILNSLEDGKHKYRQVERYLDYFNDRYSSFSKANKETFKKCVLTMLKDMEDLNKGYFTESNRISFCYEKLKEIESKIIT